MADKHLYVDKRRRHSAKKRLGAARAWASIGQWPRILGGARPFRLSHV